MSDNVRFPHVIYGVREEDIAKTFFLSMADFDAKTLLKLRLVSKEWREAIDFIYGEKLWGKLSLMEAVKDNRMDICQLIVEHAEDKNPKGRNGNTPLHVAAINGHLDIFQLIVDQVVEKSPVDNDGMTPLHWAACNGHLDICRLIMDQVVEKNPQNRYGDTPLSLATMNGHSDIVRLFSE